MKALICIVSSLILLCSCEGKSGSQTKDVRTSPSVVFPKAESSDCSIKEDAFYCVKKACLQAKGSYLEETNVCQCPVGSIFTTLGGGSCIPHIATASQVNNFLTFNLKSNRYVVTYDSKLNQKEIESIMSRRAIPIFPGRSNLYFFQSSETVREIIEQLGNSFFSMGFPSTELEEQDMNRGVSQVMKRTSIQAYFAPQEGVFDLTQLGLEDSSLIPTLTQLLNDPENFGGRRTIKSFDERGCAGICIEKVQLHENERYVFEKIRVYSGGNPLQEAIRVFNKESSVYQLAMVMLDGSISHLYVARTLGTYEVISNQGISLTTINREVQNLPQTKEELSSQSPIILFEGSYSEHADKAALIGPYEDESYYGWFQKEDRRPYYYGKNPSLLLEEDLGDATHSHKVTSIASGGFKNPIIPLAPNSLENGDVELIMRRLNSKAVASVSAAYTFSPAVCQTSSMAESIRTTSESVLWVVAAGNTGGQVNPSTFAFCPQGLQERNLMIISSHSGKGNYLSYATSFGPDYADISVNGCEHEQECPMAATSFATPRMARFMSDLISENTNVSILLLKKLVMLTARVPHNGFQNKFLPVKSGGALDEQAVRNFLELLNGSAGMTLEECLNDPEDSTCTQILTEAKEHQYPDLGRRKIKRLVKEQIKTFVKKYNH